MRVCPPEAQGQILTAVSTLIPSPVACSIEIRGIAPRRGRLLARAAGTRPWGHNLGSGHLLGDMLEHPPVQITAGFVHHPGSGCRACGVRTPAVPREHPQLVPGLSAGVSVTPLS